jgi:hypothetical protein
VCVNGEWTSNVPPCPNNCLNGECKGNCANGSKQCLDRYPQTCVNGQFASGAQCTFGCLDGACNGDCVPGSKRCLGTETVQTCDVTGVFNQVQACAFICANAADAGPNNAACTGECKPGTTECGGSTGKARRLCNKGTWELIEDCSQSCTPTKCGICVPGDKRCLVNQPQVCDQTGTFINNGTCTTQCTDTGICAP